MKGSIVAASAALVGSAMASHQVHAGFHLRRGYEETEVCEVATVYTTVYATAVPSIAPNSTAYVIPSPIPETSTPCSEESSSTPAYTPPASPSSSSVYVYVAPPPPSTSEKPVTPSSSPVYVVPSSEAYTPPAYTPPAYTPSPKPSKSASVPKPKPSKPAYGNGEYGHRITPNGQKWSITYTPYASNGQCKSASEVQSDIAKIADKGYSTIRTYSTDCGVFENVVPACQKHGLKVIYGVFLDASKGPNSQGANEQLQEIIDHAPKDSMAMLIVGNECIFAHGCQAGDLAAYIKVCKEKLIAAGFPSDIPVTTAEPVGTWEEHGAALCDVIDVFAAQVHPFFDGGVTASQAGDFALKQLEQAARVCPEAAARGKYISEIGWPKAGEANGAAVPGVSQQKEAIESIIEAVGERACIFSFQDDAWKEPGAFGVEQSFGCADILP